MLALWPLISYPRLLMLLTVLWLPHFPCLFASFTTNTWSASWRHDLDGSTRSDISITGNASLTFSTFYIPFIKCLDFLWVLSHIGPTLGYLREHLSEISTLIMICDVDILRFIHSKRTKWPWKFSLASQRFGSKAFDLRSYSVGYPGFTAAAWIVKFLDWRRVARVLKCISCTSVWHEITARIQVRRDRLFILVNSTTRFAVEKQSLDTFYLITCLNLLNLEHNAVLFLPGCRPNACTQGSLSPSQSKLFRKYPCPFDVFAY